MRLETRGDPTIIALGVRRESWTGHSQVSLGGDGTLAYVTGDNSDVGVLAWLHRSGRLDTLGFSPANSLGSDVASDGSRLAVAIPAISGNLELWVYDLGNRERQRVLNGLCSSEVRWTADGRGIYACLTGAGLVRIDPARPGQVDTLARNRVNPSSASRDGRLLLLGSTSSDSMFVLSLDGKSAPQHIVYTTGPGAYQSAFSPDGRWVAYLGRNGGVFVEPYPITGEVYRISGQLEGDVPSWSRTGDGTGVAALEAARRVGSSGLVVAIDFSEGMIRTAQLRSPPGEDKWPLNFLVMDAEDLKFSDSSFNAVISLCAVLHFPAIGKALSEMFRVLVPGGRVVVSFGYTCLIRPLPLAIFYCRQLLREGLGRSGLKPSCTAPDDLISFVRSHGVFLGGEGGDRMESS